MSATTEDESTNPPDSPSEQVQPEAPAPRQGAGYRWGARAAWLLASKAFPLVCIGVGLLVIAVRAVEQALEPIAFFAIFALAAATLLTVGHFFIRPLSELLHEKGIARRIKLGALPHERGIDFLAEIEKSLEDKNTAVAEVGVQRDRYRDLIAGINAILWEADPDTWQFRFVSPRAEGILGYPVTQWLDQPQFWAEHLHPDDRFHAVRRCLQPLNPGSYYQSDYRMMAADGRVVWLRDVLHLVLEQEPDGQTRRLVRGLAFDVTEVKLADQQLRAERESLGRLLGNLPGMAYRCRHDDLRTCEVLSDGTFALTGHHPKDLIENRRAVFAELIHPDDRPMVLERIREALAQRRPFQITYRINDANGVEKWVWEQGCGVYAPDGRVIAAEGFATDVTERVTTETENDKLAAIARANPSLVLIFDREGHCTYRNPATERFLHALGREDIVEILPPGHSEVLDQLSEASLSAASLETSVDQRIIRWLYQAVPEIGVVHLYGSDVTAARAAEASLRLSEERYRAAVEHYPGMLLIFDQDRRVRYLNSEALRVGGVPAHEVIGRRNEDVLPAATAAVFNEHLIRAYETREPQTFICTVDFPGSRKQVSCSYTPILDEAGSIREVMGVTTDISDLIETERALARERDRAQEYLELSGAIFIALDSESRITMVNRATCTTLGYQEQEMLGQSWVELCVPEREREERRQAHVRILNGEDSTGRFEFVVCTKGGEELTIAWRNNLIHDAEGNVAGILASGLDITARIQAEAAMRELNQFLDVVVDSIPDILFVKDARTRRYLRVNRAAAEALGQPAENTIGRTDHDLFPPDIAASICEEDSRVIESGQTVDRPDEHFTTGGGEELILHSRKIAISDSSGRPRYLLGICEDVTASIAAERDRAQTLSLLRATLEAAEDGILVVDSSGAILTYNKRFLELWDIPNEVIQDGRDGSALRHVLPQLTNPDGFLSRVEELYSSPDAICRDSIEFKDGRVFERYSRPQIVNGKAVGRVWSFRDRTQAIRAEREVRESREFLDMMMLHSSDVIGVIDDETNIRYISGSCERLLGYSQAELLGERGMDLLPEDARATAAASLLATLTSNPGGETGFRLPFRHRDGSIRIMEGVGRNLRDHPAIRGILLSCHDITERDYNERVSGVLARILQAVNETSDLPELLKFSREQISTLMDVTNFYVALYDEARQLYTFPFIADEVENADDISPQAMRHSVTDYVRRTGQAMLVDEAVQRRLEEEHEIQVVGHWSPIWLGVPLRTSGPVFGVMAVQSYHDPNLYGPRELRLLSNIAERIAMAVERKRVADARDRLATAVDQILEIVVITDANGNIQYVNPAFTRVTGYSPKEAIGLTPRLLSSGRHPREFYEQFWNTLAAGNTWRGQFINKKKDGTLYHEEATVTPVRDPNGKIVNFVAIKRDISDELQMEAKLRQAQKLESVGSLAAGIAHEINTPIQFVGDNVRFMKESFHDIISLMDRVLELVKVVSDPPGDTVASATVASDAAGIDLDYLKVEIPKAIEQTLEGVDRIATIVRAMKDFSHPDRGEKLPSDINRALASTLTVARNEFKYVADLITDFDDSLPSVWCSLSDLNQAFLNIIVNAAHAIGDAQAAGRVERGTITVRTKRVEHGVLISVSDTGTGVPEEIRERIFDHFFTTKEVGRGTGQGLAIARSVVVDKHGGELTFETEMGSGTTFHIRLPVGAPSESELEQMLERQ